MFKILPIQNKNEQIEISAKCGSSYQDGFFAYSMKEEDGRLLGFSQFDIRGEEAYISDIKAADGVDDYEAMFILGRSTMNFIDMCGAHKAYAPYSCADESFMLALGFKRQDEGFFVDMTGFFGGCCSK